MNTEKKVVNIETYKIIAKIILRNRLLLTVICYPIYHWLEVSREVDISRARKCERYIHWRLNDNQWYIGQQITC